jgi:hypothetical protein
MKPTEFSYNKFSSILLLIASLLISITLGAWNMGALTQPQQLPTDAVSNTVADTLRL